MCCRVFNSKHSGINIAKMMKRLFVEFHIEKKVFQILSDNASNMIKAVRDLQAMEEGDELDDFDDDGEDGEDSGVDEGSDCDLNGRYRIKQNKIFFHVQNEYVGHWQLVHVQYINY